MFTVPQLIATCFSFSPLHIGWQRYVDHPSTRFSPSSCPPAPQRWDFPGTITNRLLIVQIEAMLLTASTEISAFWRGHFWGSKEAKDIVYHDIKYLSSGCGLLADHLLDTRGYRYRSDFRLLD
ncbi:hypothetical protein PoB_007342200 [Plakobranchus ocellatus]|uniref:Uncharacterized protein n=1 Tax=Plakobranchus ocellatus TaxID=259542 RepID=A0AAV4DRJ4_9GAST|nr:hypothetical protein PoB_007342200 [Plakobranchus ocellatus]